MSYSPELLKIHRERILMKMNSCRLCEPCRWKCDLYKELIEKKVRVHLNLIEIPCYCRPRINMRWARRDYWITNSFVQETYWVQELNRRYHQVMLRHNGRIAALLLGVNSIIRCELPVKSIRRTVVAYLYS